MSNDNFFTRLFASILGGNNPDSDKKKQLRSIAKQINKSKYKYYKTSSNEISPSFAKLFYDINKVISPAQLIFQNINNPNVFKMWVIEYIMTPQQSEIATRLTEEYINEQIKTVPIKTISENVKNDWQLLSSSFDTKKIATTDEIYNKLLSFVEFCNYDYYFMLKKFSSQMKEKDFSVTPNFESLRAEYIADDLTDFISIAWGLSLIPTDWNTVFDVIKNNKGVSPIALNIWAKLIAKLKDLKSSEIFEMMIKLACEDPNAKVTVNTKNERITEPYLEKIKKNIDTILQNLEQHDNDTKVNGLVSQIFSDSQLSSLKYYTENASEVIQNKNLIGYEYANALCYTKNFLIEYVKKDLRTFCDLVLVRGKWVTPNLASPMSDAYHELLVYSDNITAFDETLADDREMGTKIKTYLLRAEKEGESRNIMISLLETVNNEAYEYILKTTQALILIGKNIKNLIEDFEKQRPVLITNWKELVHFSDEPIKQSGVSLYKKIYLFVSLMQIFLSKKEN